MRRSAPPAGRFDALKLSARHGELSGHVDVSKLPRVADLLADSSPASEVSYRISGSVDDSGRAVLDVALHGAVPLVCQRCLKAFEWPIEQTTRLLLAADEQSLARLDDEDAEHEVMLAAEPLDPVELVEDELVLTLPFVPRCAEATCVPSAPGPTAEVAPKASPFAALSQVPRRGAKKDD